jgi:uncharacterized protein YuzE
MADYPQVHEESQAVVVDFDLTTQQSSRQPLRMVLDFGQQGEVLGIEIINLAYVAGQNCLQAISKSIGTDGQGLRFSYDDESDCFYLRLREGQSLTQKAVDGFVLLDQGGAITNLSVDWGA